MRWSWLVSFVALGLLAACSSTTPPQSEAPRPDELSALTAQTQATGAVVGWGDNPYGIAESPPDLGDDVVAVSGGRVHSVALRSDGTVVAWGKSTVGICCNQIYVPEGLDDVVAIDAARFHSLALKRNGTVVGWGDNRNGQTDVPEGFDDAIAVAAGPFNSYALKEDGTVVGWGSLPRVPAGLTDVVAIDAGWNWGMALKQDGSVVIWPDDSGTAYHGLVPLPTEAQSGVVDIAAGWHHVLALKDDGTVIVWGANHDSVDRGQRDIPEGLNSVVAIDAGGSHSIALKDDGSIVAWGYDYYGQSTPPTDIKNPITIAAGVFHNLAIVPTNASPTASAGGAYEGTEASLFSMASASASDPDGDPLTYAWTVSDPTLCSFSDPTVLNPDLTCTDNGSFTATLTVSDGVADPVSDTAAITVTNVPPTIEGITTDGADPSNPVIEVNTSLAITASFSDPAGSYDEPYVCTFDYNNDGLVDETVTGVTGASCSGATSYTEPGVYTVAVTVTDKDGGTSDPALFEYVTVYDPSAGFVTGGGWIDSPPGAYRPNDSTYDDVTGKATFGFVSRYKKGASTPTGNTAFRFRAGDLTFQSYAYDWMVIAGQRAQFQGTGNVNGQDGYRFFLVAMDGDINGGSTTDAFRISIWNDNGTPADEADDTRIYDNHASATKDSDATTALRGGSIVIHKK